MFTIRKATSADADQIVKLAHQTWWPTYSEILSAEQISYMLSVNYLSDKIADQIAAQSQVYLILEEDSQAVAFASYSVREDNSEVYKLQKLYCHPTTQGKGYGKALIDYVAAEVLKAGKKTLELNVNRGNKAKNFYEKMGFVVAYEEDIPIGPYWMNDYVMRKLL